jgi:hypothetical protein
VSSEKRAVDLAINVFMSQHGGDASAVSVVSVSKERIPNPPLEPGQVSIDPVRYRFFVHLRGNSAEARYRVEGGNVYRG